MCSSGTTGLSKGVALPHEICIRVFIPFWTLPKGETEIAFNFSTLYWITGVTFMVTAALYNHTRVFTRRTPTPELLIEIVEKYKVTLVLSAPFFLASLVNYQDMRPLPSIKSYMCGGSVLNAVLSEGARKFLPNGEVRVIYGATEVCGIITVGYPNVKYGSAGLVAPNVDIKIIDENDNLLGAMEQGEVCIRTKIPFLVCMIQCCSKGLNITEYFRDTSKIPNKQKVV
jgi:acyl-coenzyme A synthetase/AMP-(fatty) acid ligase